jgi:hypothetical protein
VITRRPVRALSCLAAGAASVGVAISMLRVNPGSDQDLDLQVTFWLVSAAVLAVGVIAAGLAGASNGSTPRPEVRLVTQRVVAVLAFLASAYFLLGGISTLLGSTVGVPTAPLLGKAALFAFIGWGFWRGGLRSSRARTG